MGGVVGFSKFRKYLIETINRRKINMIELVNYSSQPCQSTCNCGDKCQCREKEHHNCGCATGKCTCGTKQ